MTRFVIADPSSDIAVGVPFEAFLDIVKSSAIRSAATGDNFFEIGTSENVNVRFQATPDGDIQITMVSTLNKGEVPPLRLQLSGDDEPMPAAEVERRIRALRQAYAIAYMVEERRTVKLSRVLTRDPQADIEEACLAPQERLYIGTLTPGSVWLTLLTKSKKAYTVARYGLALSFSEGRMAFLERLKADTKLKQLEVEEKEDEIKRKRYAGAIDTVKNIEKIKDPALRQQIMGAFVQQIAGVTGVPSDEVSTALAPPEDKRLVTESVAPVLMAAMKVVEKPARSRSRGNGSEPLQIAKKAERDRAPD